MNWQFSNEELRQLMQGQFRFDKCLTCDGKGLEVVRDEEYEHFDECCACEGLGGFLEIKIDSK